MENQNNNNFFDEDEITYLTAIGKYDAIRKAIALGQTVDLLPDDPQVLLDRIDKEIPNDYEKGIEKLKWIEEHDLKFFIQIVALFEVLNEAHEEEAKVEKLDLNTIRQQEENEMFDLIMKKIKGEE